MSTPITTGQVEADPLRPQIPEVVTTPPSGNPEGGVNQSAPDLEPIYVDYFGFDETHTFTFPDKVSQIYFKAMNEGDRARFQRETNRDVQLERNTGNARIKTDQAGERKALIMASCTGWNLRKRNPQNGQLEPVPFSTGSSG